MAIPVRQYVTCWWRSRRSNGSEAVDDRVVPGNEAVGHGTDFAQKKRTNPDAFEFFAGGNQVTPGRRWPRW